MITKHGSDNISMTCDIIRTWLENACHLPDVALLVWHVLAALARPDHVERVVWKVHVESIHDAEFDVRKVALPCKLHPSVHLFSKTLGKKKQL